MTPRSTVMVALLLGAIAAGTAGCSWLVGVSGDPEVVDLDGGSDAADEDAASHD